MQKTITILILMFQIVNIYGQESEIISLDTAYENSSIEEVMVVYKNFKKKGDFFNEVSYLDKQGQLLYRITKKECYPAELKGRRCETTFEKLTDAGKRHGYQKKEVPKELEEEKISFKYRRRFRIKNKRKKERKWWRFEENEASTSRKIINLKDTTLLWEVINEEYQIEMSLVKETYTKKKIVLETAYINDRLASKIYYDFRNGIKLKACYFNDKSSIDEIWVVKDINKPNKFNHHLLQFYPNGNPKTFYDFMGGGPGEIIKEWAESGELILNKH